MKKATTLLFILTMFVSSSYGQATKRVILEDQTDVWCGYCPRGKTVMGQIMTANPNVIGIANHVTAIGPDSMANSYSLNVDGAVNTYGYPGGMVDRNLYSDQTKVVFARNFWQAEVTKQLALTTPLKVDVISSYDSATRTVTASVRVKYMGAYTVPAGSDLRIS